jgi:hypothetical protein
MSVNTGYCNVGSFGGDQRMDDTMIGGPGVPQWD